MARLDGKRALVTGGGSGIGAAIASRFREEGAAVLTADVMDGDIECDVRSRASVEACVDGCRRASRRHRRARAQRRQARRRAPSTSSRRPSGTTASRRT